MNQDKDQKSKDKFGPHHFPPGTVFTVSPVVASTGPTEFVASHVVRNGPKSWVVVTTAPPLHESIGTTRSFNLAWVDSISKRGEGRVVIDHSWYGVNHRRKAERINDVWRASLPRHQAWNGPRQGHYATGSVLSVLLHEVCIIFNEGDSVSVDKVWNAVRTQGWCKSVIGKHDFTINVLNKKKLRSFLRRNRNRFLVDLEVWDAKEKADMDAYIDEDAEAFYREQAAFDTPSSEDDTQDEVVIRNPVDERMSREDERFLGALPDLRVSPLMPEDDPKIA